MEIEDKIKKKIKEKGCELQKFKKAEKEISKKNMNKFEKDLGFWNSLNPFYKRQYNTNKDFAGMLFFATNFARLENEIEELKSLLNTTKGS